MPEKNDVNLPLSSFIIFEDEDLLILNKPSGTIVNDAISHHQLSLQTQVATYLDLPPRPSSLTINQFSSTTDVWLDRQGMVHRLDKDTSGVMVWAKNPAALKNLLSQFRLRQTQKTYLCLVHGFFGTDKTGRIHLPLGRKTTNRQLMAVTPNGREATTNYQVVQEFHHFDFLKLKKLHPDFPLGQKDLLKLYQGFSLISAQPKTGRTHQLRAHFTHLKHPLVGDTAYLSRHKAKIDPNWCPRQFLHASSLTLTHPSSGKILTFNAVLPPDLVEVLTFIS